MRVKPWLAVMLIAMSIMLGACGGEQGDAVLDLNADFKDVQSTDLSKETGGLPRLDVTEQEVRAARGEPLQERTTDRGGHVFIYEDYEYSFVEEKHVGYSVNKGTTEKGVGVGDSRETVIQKYGEHYAERQAEEVSFLGYMDKERGLVLDFLLADGKVEKASMMFTEVK